MASADVTLRRTSSALTIEELGLRVPFTGSLDDARALICSDRRLARVELNVFGADGSAAPRYLGSNAAAAFGAEPETIVVRGPGRLGKKDQELVVCVGPQDVRVFGSEDREPCAACPLDAVVAFALGDRSIAMALTRDGDHDVLSLTGARELDVAKGKWMATTQSRDRIVERLTRHEVPRLPDDVAAVTPSNMAAVADVLAQAELFPWSTAEKLAALSRFDALDALARAWPEPPSTDARQALEYARFYFRIASGDVSTALPALRAADPEVWPRLYREDQPGYEPNLFAMLGAHDRAAWAYARQLSAPPASRSDVWFRRVAVDLAFSLLATGDGEAARDAMAAAHLYEFWSVDAWTSLARFHARVGNAEGAATWFGLSLLHADRLRSKQNTLAEMVDAGVSAEKVRAALRGLDLEAIALAPAVVDPTTVRVLYADVLRISRRIQTCDAKNVLAVLDDAKRLASRWPAIEWTWAFSPCALVALDAGIDMVARIEAEAGDGIAPAVANALAAALERTSHSAEATPWRERAAKVEAPPWRP